ncbi:hypothetical protein GALL_405580 [mine drainage metagenome]|uniref:CsgH-like domain-containing protein n=1 Tax=mine drainage metagenome TaxID=410659 RepID=A0A1J5QJQ8_9ZZZZ
MLKIDTSSRSFTNQDPQLMIKDEALRRLKRTFVIALLIFSGEKVHAMSTIQCEIKSRPVNNGSELTGVIWADQTTQGDYHFAVSSQGAGGTSNVVQSGLFALQPNEPKVIGAVVVNAGSGSSFSARLSVRSDEGVQCITHN